MPYIKKKRISLTKYPTLRESVCSCCTLCCDYVVQSDNLRSSSLHALVRTRRSSDHMKSSSLHAMVRLRRPLRCDYVIQTDHMEGNSLHAMLGLHRAEQPLEKQLPARSDANTFFKVTT